MFYRCLMMLFSFAVGLLFYYLKIPIPFMLGGIITAATVKFFIRNEMRWPVLWRNFGLVIAGYGIGRDFTQNTLIRMSEQLAGVFGAAFIAIGISVFTAWVTDKFGFVVLHCKPDTFVACQVLYFARGLFTYWQIYCTINRTKGGENMLAVNYSTLRNNLKAYCDKATDESETVIVTRKNEKNVVIMSLEKYNNLRENLFLMQNRKNYQHILQGIEELEQGQTVTKVAEDLEEFLIE